jgi:cold shock CspA family protein
MLGHYGWILPLEDIDHPASAHTDGKVYIHKRDIADGTQLAEGDVVGFYLYSDDQGLGAEEARCLEKATAKSFNASALEFVPKSQGMNSNAYEFVPADSLKSPTIRMDKSAVEFMPFGCNASMSNVARLQSVFAINLSYLSDDSSDDEDSDFEERPRREVGKAAERCLSPGASTSAGLSSDDEDDIAAGTCVASWPEACLEGQKFRPPPGLTLPSSPCPLAVGILTRAGMSVAPEQQQKLPPWRRDGKSSFADVVSKGFTPPWRQSNRLVACA